MALQLILPSIGVKVRNALVKIYLARHAQTAWSKESRYAGTSDISLTQAGQEQAAFLGKRLSHSPGPIVAVYSSSLQRSIETADIIAEPLSVAVCKLPEFDELNYGLWEGLNPAQVLRKFPTEYRRWVRNPATASPSKGETGKSLVRRAEPILERLTTKHAGETIVIVGHKALNRLLLCSQLGIPLRRCRDTIEQDEACLNVLSFTPGPGMRLLKLNDTSHYDS
jgi:broad specificity phosphatase PhoE